METGIEPDDALVIVDVQRDFLPGGALAVPEGDRIIGAINVFSPRFRRVYATRDWHPPDHLSFAQCGGPWPVHCVAGSEGARLDDRLDASHIDRTINKGTARDTEGYSGFDATDLAADLRAHGVRRVFVCGLATDYCVKATALDAKAQGFEVVVLSDACAAVNVHPNDEAAALEELNRAGVRIANSSELSSSREGGAALA